MPVHARDSHPHTFELEIDRDRLRRFYRVQAFLAWLTPLVLFGGMIGLARVGDMVDRSMGRAGKLPPPIAPWDAVLLFVKWGAIGAGLGCLVAWLCYLIFNHRHAGRRAASLRVTVEGAFLHLREEGFTMTDKKVHFRALVDYTVMQTFLMRRCGVEALRISTTGGGLGALVAVSGLKDCVKARDLLAEVDEAREK